MFCRPILPLVVAALLGVPAAQALPVRFELKAPDAHQVFLAGEMTDWDRAKLPMTQGPDGVWRTTVDLASGQWLYKFVVDGLWITDPVGTQNDADGMGGRHSFVFVGDGDWAAHAGVRAGRVDTVELASAAWGAPVKLNIYLPPGFKPGRPLPVLYLLHGYGMDADQWFKTGQIHHFMDNLIAQTLIHPFVVVMPSSGKEAYTGASERFLTTELPAWLKQRYGLRLASKQAGVAGMSMGGFGAFYLALQHPDLFGIAVALSGAYPQAYVADLAADKRLPFKFIQLCGSEDEWVGSNRMLARALLARGDAFYYREDSGAHSFQYWNHRMPEMLLAADAYFTRGYARHNEDSVQLPAPLETRVRGLPLAYSAGLGARLLGRWQGEWVVEGGAAKGRFEQTLTLLAPDHAEGTFSVYGGPGGDKIDVPFSAPTEQVPDCTGCSRFKDINGEWVTTVLSEEDGQLWRQWTIHDHGATVFLRVRKVSASE